MKMVKFAILVFSVCFTTALFANAQIQGKHKGLKKDGKVINCALCHTASKIEKKKGGYPIAKVNQNPTCMGAGCHPVKK